MYPNRLSCVHVEYTSDDDARLAFWKRCKFMFIGRCYDLCGLGQFVNCEATYLCNKTNINTMYSIYSTVVLDVQHRFSKPDVLYTRFKQFLKIKFWYIRIEKRVGFVEREWIIQQVDDNVKGCIGNNTFSITHRVYVRFVCVHVTRTTSLSVR